MKGPFLLPLVRDSYGAVFEMKAGNTSGDTEALNFDVDFVADGKGVVLVVAIFVGFFVIIITIGVFVIIIIIVVVVIIITIGFVFIITTTVVAVFVVAVAVCRSIVCRTECGAVAILGALAAVAVCRSAVCRTIY